MVKGWWRISIKASVLQRLDRMREEIEINTGEKVSYSTLIERLLQNKRSEKT